MYNAFLDGFKAGYKKIVLIGSDLPNISSKHILKGFDVLNENDVVFGPAEDGGYYLIGLKKEIPELFINKPWSQPQLLENTLEELKVLRLKV